MSSISWRLHLGYADALAGRGVRFIGQVHKRLFGFDQRGIEDRIQAPKQATFSFRKYWRCRGPQNFHFEFGGAAPSDAIKETSPIHAVPLSLFSNRRLGERRN